jgi:hypothetical protein
VVCGPELGGSDGFCSVGSSPRPTSDEACSASASCVRDRKVSESLNQLSTSR